MLSATKKQSISAKTKQETLMAKEEGKKKEIDSAYSYMSIFHSPIHKTKVRRVDLKFYPYQDRAYVSALFGVRRCLSASSHGTVRLYGIVFVSEYF